MKLKCRRGGWWWDVLPAQTVASPWVISEYSWVPDGWEHHCIMGGIANCPRVATNVVAAANHRSATLVVMVWCVCVNLLGR